MNEIILLIFIGLAAGMLGGLFGVGGGIIVIPALIYLLGMTQHQAQGTSVAFMLLPVGLLAFINYYKNGYINIKYAAILAAAFFVGAFFGSKIAINLSSDTLRKVFAVLVVITGIKLFFD